MPDVAAVIVTYNALLYVDRCLESVERHETVVVDHGSTDGTVELVRERFPRATVVEQDNRGLAAGWNTGIRRTSAPYVLVLNADAWIVRD
ncbi:MAG: glycosyltransferase, partial [Actinomycetota bacterium]|nr:glycosyltransferase [Actinomycetota bacterium]